ncbi:sugar transferase [Cesiribacter andamanensis]|uniref:Putative colanic biosynthesis UDP-glucose lipid carrier transferase n=1 Tax=Cesiribacter andamanensis AMV16 TaxID=1279009 RepID=M7N6Y8_9BACT|nr:sugar transferase [Cesiribacter andamanensis]EMR03042.1 Putative colanic biosynthesis UDP-glucose lipid carrier transferase [Cesiribacter andamanensis AMV16]
MRKINDIPAAPVYSNTIVYVGQAINQALVNQLQDEGYNCLQYTDAFKAYVYLLAEVYANAPLPYAILCQEDLKEEEAYTFIANLARCHRLRTVPSILLLDKNEGANKRKAKLAGADDFYTGPVSHEDLLERLEFLHATRDERLEQTDAQQDFPHLRISLGKRLFDILFSGILLILLSPILLVIALAIRLESPGPIFYISKRVGTGYRIFNFYKFRSMRPDADKELEKVIHLNQYQSQNGGLAFVKIDNDPRVTRLGRFLRNSSLDELPQLFNVLLGDMSIVGNRPLPLYEAEKITRDLWSKRFLAPAGITGLWQVTKRGRKEMSTEERIELDMQYADECSLWYDFKIMAQTVPALLQKESV